MSKVVWRSTESERTPLAQIDDTAVSPGARKSSAALRSAGGSAGSCFDEASSADIGDVVRAGLSMVRKQLPPHLFYDSLGSELFEAITNTPEYYVTRCERAILEQHASEIVDTLQGGSTRAPCVIELGAGTATKSQILLSDIGKRFGHCIFMPIDVCASPLLAARTRMAVEVPEVTVCPLVTSNEDAVVRLRAIRHRKVLLFLGSSIGNCSDDEAANLLSMIRANLSPGDAVLLGTDLVKDTATLLAAYDDAGGVTAAFNKNLLTRINREVGAKFDTRLFRHKAVWNARKRAIEMHLESIVDQLVFVNGMNAGIRFHVGETIHTETSAKYDEGRVDALLTRARLVRERTFSDGQFALHVIRVVSDGA